MVHLPKGQGVFLPPFKAWLASNIPAVYDNTMTYYEELCALIKYLQDVVIPALNHNAEAVTTIATAVEKLQKYVEDYFKNLDVQEEINNKLDAMAEDGTLQEIITAYIQSNVAWIFDTVSDMKSSTNLIAGSYARTLGYYAIGDGGGATYKIDDTSTANEMDIIQIGSDSLFAVLVTDSTKNVKQFGAKGDGTQDDTAFIQRAINTLQTNDVLYIPKGSNSTYKITDSLTLSANDVCIYSEPKTEYSTSIICTTANKTILNVTGYGVTVKNMSFYGDGGDGDTTHATVDGINFDRTSVGDAEEYSNIDCAVEDCLFMKLDSCITVKGRNARIKNNTFTLSKNGIVGLLHKYSSDTETSELRGFFIQENVFHSMNNYSDALTGKTLDTLGSACISLPLESNKVSEAHIFNNKAEYCNSIFYKGFLVECLINGNASYFGLPTLVYCPCEDAALTNQSASRTSQISNNIVRGKSNTAFTDCFVSVKGINNVKLSDNNFRQCSGNGVVGINSPRFIITNNFIQGYGTSGSAYSAIDITGSEAIIKGNTINSFINSNYGITSTANVNLEGNKITGTVSNGALHIAGNYIIAQGYSTAWQSVTLQNNFEFGTDYNQGIRKLENGSTQVVLELKGGTDNEIAFQLPSGFRPSTAFVIPEIVLNPDQDAKAYARFYTSGDVRINWGGADVGSSTRFIINTIFQ